MELTSLISQPEKMNKETLYDLRGLLALYPYYQTARLLLLQNLYVLHDSSFDEELRRAAIYVTDRKVIFRMIEAAHYRLRSEKKVGEENKKRFSGDRTTTLIDDFLDSIPCDSEVEKKGKRRPTPADAAVDYVAYLMETESADEMETSKDAPMMKGQSLIDSFLEDGGFNLNFSDGDGKEEITSDEQTGVSNTQIDKENNSESPVESPVKSEEQSEEQPTEPIEVPSENAIEASYEDEVEESVDEETQKDVCDDDEKENHESPDGSFTLTLAKIYIKQGRYEKALEIIQQLNLNYPKKNAYFADQIRFLQKLIINNKNKK
nr:tetratricopeptide repeat protein [Prevotella sp.]